MTCDRDDDPSRSRASTSSTTRTSRSTSRARPVTSCTGSPCRPTYPQPKEVAGCFDHGGRLRPRTWSPSGAYMYFGADKHGHHGGCNTLKPIAGYQPREGHHDRPQPELRPVHVRSGHVLELPGRGADRDQLQRGRHLPEDPERAISTGRSADTPAGHRGAGVRDEPGPAAVHPLQPGRPHLVHHDEPARAAVRRPAVRKAVQWVVDKAALVKGYGGSLHADPATTVDAAIRCCRRRPNYDPYPSEGFAGDVDQAQDEMKQSEVRHEPGRSVRRPGVLRLPAARRATPRHGRT